MRARRPRMDRLGPPTGPVSPSEGPEAVALHRSTLASLCCDVTGSTPIMAETCVRGLLLAALALGGAHAWGGLFNRFSPEALNNLAYSGHSRQYPYMRDGERAPHAHAAGETLEDAAAELAAECYGAPCYDNVDCCPANVCYNPNGDEYGRCLPATFGRKLGELCSRDNQCDAGLLCEEVLPGEPRVCRPPTSGQKQYNQECSMSAECDVTRGLCCSVQRRHRQKPRKSCTYFKDPLICIGPVATDQIREPPEHTAGEKRLGFFQHLH